MVKSNKLKNILMWLFGLATLSTFFYSNTTVTDFFSVFNLIRLIVVMTFLVLVLSTFKGVPKVDSPMGGDRYKTWVSTAVWLLPMIACVFAIINVVLPEVGNVIVKGGDLVPFRPAIYVKMTFDLVSCSIFIILATKMSAKKNHLLLFIFALLALITFWMAMEEISWGQRIFKWETTGYFAENNMQQETNLHNLNTQLFQNFLYFGGFILLVVLPFFRDHIAAMIKKVKPLRSLTFMLPGAWMIGAFAMAIGFNDPYVSDVSWRWGSIFFEIIATAAILGVYFFRLTKLEDGRSKYITLTITSFITVLALSLASSRLQLQDTGSPTEYIELFIALGIMSWAIDLNIRSKDKNYRHLLDKKTVL